MAERIGGLGMWGKWNLYRHTTKVPTFRRLHSGGSPRYIARSYVHSPNYICRALCNFAVDFCPRQERRPSAANAATE